ncbi:MAG: hypothetical protein P4L76_13375 [Beijerinckiaceae bacterium]|nr:hypothetical protein [Beijerinckiaceae bacterium]
MTPPRRTTPLAASDDAPNDLDRLEELIATVQRNEVVRVTTRRLVDMFVLGSLFGGVLALLIFVAVHAIHAR